MYSDQVGASRDDAWTLLFPWRVSSTPHFIPLKQLPLWFSEQARCPISAAPKIFISAQNLEDAFRGEPTCMLAMLLGLVVYSFVIALHINERARAAPHAPQSLPFFKPHLPPISHCTPSLSQKYSFTLLQPKFSHSSWSNSLFPLLPWSWVP